MSQKRNKETTDEARREFLRKSVYAAYATPVITALLVSKASAALSTPGQPPTKPDRAKCQSSGGQWVDPPGCCDDGPILGDNNCST